MPPVEEQVPTIAEQKVPPPTIMISDGRAQGAAVVLAYASPDR